MKKLFYFSSVLILLTGITACGTTTNGNNLATAPIIQTNSTPNQIKIDTITASQAYLKSKAHAKEWSKDTILINCSLDLQTELAIYYYSKQKQKILYYLPSSNSFNEVNEDEPLSFLPEYIKAPYIGVLNWKIDSDKALEIGKEYNAAMGIHMEFNQITKKFEWKISDNLNPDVYVDISTGKVRTKSN